MKIIPWFLGRLLFSLEALGAVSLSDVWGRKEVSVVWYYDACRVGLVKGLPCHDSHGGDGCMFLPSARSLDP